MNFRELSETELSALEVEELVAYIARARRARRVEEAVKAAQILAWSQERAIRGFVATKMQGRGDAAWNEVAERVVFDAIRSAEQFQGGSAGEFRAWVFTIARRRIVDFIRRKGQTVEVPLERESDDGEPSERQLSGGDPTGAAELKSIFRQALDGLNDAHKLVILLVRFHDLPHKKVADEVNRHFGDGLDDSMTEQNVAKINSRFGKELRRLLDAADQPPAKDDGED